MRKLTKLTPYFSIETAKTYGNIIKLYSSCLIVFQPWTDLRHRRGSRGLQRPPRSPLDRIKASWERPNFRADHQRWEWFPRMDFKNLISEVRLSRKISAVPSTRRKATGGFHRVDRLCALLIRIMHLFSKSLRGGPFPASNIYISIRIGCSAN